MLIFGPLAGPRISAVTRYRPSSAGSLTTLPSSTTRTAGSVTLAPTSPASLSTVRTSSTDAFSCLPPQRTIAYTECLSRCLRSILAGSWPSLAARPPRATPNEPAWARTGVTCRTPGIRLRARATVSQAHRPLSLSDRRSVPFRGRCRCGWSSIRCAGAGYRRRRLPAPPATARRRSLAVRGCALRGRRVHGAVRAGRLLCLRLPCLRRCCLRWYCLRRCCLRRCCLRSGLPARSRGALPATAAGPAVRSAPAVTYGRVLDRFHRDQHAAPVAVLARDRKRLQQAGAHPLPGHLHQAERRHLGHLVLGAVPGQALEQPAHHQFPVALQHHVDEVDH